MPLTSSYPPIGGRGASLHQLIAGAAAGRAERPALVNSSTGEVVSYGLLAARIGQVAAGLASRGFGPGDVLALWAPNLPQWAGIALGAMAAGGTVAPVDTSCTEPELTGRLTGSGASILVTIPSMAPTALAAAGAAGVAEVVTIGQADGATPIGALLVERALESGARPAAPVDPSTVALLPCSSGTTGLPKGVMLTHANLVAGTLQLNTGFGATDHDTLLAVAPFFHIMGFAIHLGVALSVGATVVTMARFEPERFLALVERHRVTALAVPPPIMRLLATHPMVDAHDLSSLRIVVCGGAPLSAELHRAVSARLRHTVVGTGWGLTETTCAATVPDRDGGTVPGSVGRLAPSGELRVVDPATGADLGKGQPGELWFRGPNVMAGYRDAAGATAEILDADGWLRTGDLGTVDADGNVFILGRLKELIKVNARQVAPAELEAVLAAQPAVADAAVIGRADPEHGEVPVAVVVPRGEVDGDQLMGWVAERVAPYKRLRAIRFVEAIPRTPSGKILRRVLIEGDRRAEAV